MAAEASAAAAFIPETQKQKRKPEEENGQKGKKEKRRARFAFKTREQTRKSNGSWILYGNKPLNYNNEESLSLEHNKIIYFTKQIISDLYNADPGLYTWIIRGTTDNNTIYASKTRSMQELGTLHKNLLDLTKNKDNRPLFAAGELKINPQGVIEFNLQSGVFNTEILTKYKTKEKKLKFVNDTVVPAVIQAMNRAGVLQVKYLDCKINEEPCDETEETGGKHILSKQPIISTNENIDIYNRFFNHVNTGVVKNNNSKKGGSKKHRRHRKKSIGTKKRRL